MEQAESAVINNAAAGQFELRADGQVASLNYSVSGGHIRLIHTEVPAALRGRGYADELARAGLEYARRERLRVLPLCPFVRAYMERHPEYVTLVDED
jgi:predicted GNAT family acetyltransferase